MNWRDVRRTLREPWLRRRLPHASNREHLLRPAVVGGRWRWLHVVVACGPRTVVVTVFTGGGRLAEVSR